MFIYIADMLEKLDRQEWSEYEDYPYMFFVYWADVQGLTEHGVSVRCSWLDDKGRELLAEIRSAQEVTK